MTSPPPLLSRFLNLHQEGLPQGSLLPHMPHTGTYHNHIGLGVHIPGLARNPRTSFRDKGGGEFAHGGPFPTAVSAWGTLHSGKEVFAVSDRLGPSSIDAPAAGHPQLAYGITGAY